ncbi:LysR substrate-binding domain-containing protein [Microbacterium horticulturae]|uniref:LysR substrate-binding domain-containing protein n=1 Tax=Microbacterium horticulturae TaxID=3028316 RepID=A0ABY8BX54_9MICO|nr:LysR substrate-binding domain-containing protein [Microbacterium sp. KACC 23027]WEG08472.1 LysR substrate-binding domain-containing protein [Microbacterium sp. KACC 23027]
MSDGLDTRVDGNLVVALEALLVERSVPRVAARLHVGESTATSALRRLRRITGDRLLVRSGGQHELTPLARELLPLVHDAMSSINRALEGGPHFDPRQSDRTFWISASGYAQAQLGAALARLVRGRAPGVRLRMTSLDADGFTLDTLFSRDIVLAHIGGHVTGPRKILFEDELVVVVAADHPALRDGRLDLAAISSMRLVSGTGGQTIPPLVQQMFQGISDIPRIAINAASDQAIPDVVAGSDFLGVVPRRLVEMTARRRHLVIAETPLRRVPLIEAAHWHPSKKTDPAIAWLVGLVRDAVTASGLGG